MLRRVSVADEQSIRAIGRRGEAIGRVERALVELAAAEPRRIVVHARHDLHLLLAILPLRHLFDQEGRIGGQPEAVRPQLDPQDIPGLRLEAIPIDVASRVELSDDLGRQREGLRGRGRVVPGRIGDDRSVGRNQEHRVRGARGRRHPVLDRVERELRRLEPLDGHALAAEVGRHRKPHRQAIEPTGIHRKIARCASRQVPPIGHAIHRRSRGDGRWKHEGQARCGRHADFVPVVGAVAMHRVGDDEHMLAVLGKLHLEAGIRRGAGTSLVHELALRVEKPDHRIGTRVDAAGEHLDREPLPPGAGETKAVDVSATREATIDDAGHRQLGCLGRRVVRLRLNRVRHGVDHEHAAVREPVASPTPHGVMPRRHVRGDGDDERVGERARPVVERAGIRLLRHGRDARMREDDRFHIVEIRPVDRDVGGRAGSRARRKDRVEPRTWQLGLEGRGGRGEGSHEESTHDSRAGPSGAAGLRPSRHRRPHQTNWNSFVLRIAQRTSSHACCRFVAAATCATTRSRSASVGRRQSARR